MIKPPYKVSSMQEIAAIPWNGFNAISTFSGCGGSSLGYKMAGFKVLWANEFISAAQDTYRANHPNTILDTRDIRQVQPEEILKAVGLKEGELDLFDGSPPCAAFSTAGKREAGWGKVKQYSDTKQRVDDLFFEYARILKGLQPKVFVAENVSGLVKGTAKGYFKLILEELKSCGYNVKVKVLDAQWLGVPQMRERTIFIGVRNDLGLEPIHPKPLGYRYTVREAIPWIYQVEEANGLNSKGLGGHRLLTLDNKAFPTIQAQRPVYVEAETDISKYAIGKEWESIKPGGQSKKYFQLTKAPIDGQCGTITAEGGNTSLASITHPTEKRKFSITELKRIGGFPDDFILTGTYAQQWERIGRAVPPVMMYYIAKTISDEILCKIQK